ncbi:helix-turn-helix transcriptional regulator (plasmid) [Macrococcus psychrotolerans]|uniref:Helix-turn-helix transcriptional regulator n=1 Tax=Macrococcus psychrotolerans TaxID=3039389 RepID=A0AAT9P8W7_9STAP|nr:MULTISPECIES: helix-turn-helix transcriptional regulator [Macrococcus]QYA34189.1 helix-turn-helix domain-containing protein [Macrococcus sp. 19Msa1099]QYA38991.1 helix-turn-helix domain-containing protein [Macrococcus caseolyticus]QYA77732.1 helix-turn-helix domain-containing protein [Macrococcus caseolyticus]
MILLNEKLKGLRKKKGKTQQQMAEDLSISIQSINKWENGKCLPDAINLLNISKYFNVSIDDLLNNKINGKLVESKKFKFFNIFN